VAIRPRPLPEGMGLKNVMVPTKKPLSKEGKGRKNIEDLLGKDAKLNQLGLVNERKNRAEGRFNYHSEGWT